MLLYEISVVEKQLVYNVREIYIVENVETVKTKIIVSLLSDIAS